MTDRRNALTSLGWRGRYPPISQMMDIGEFKHILDDASGRYVLLGASSDQASFDNLLVYDTVTQTMLIVEDDNLAAELIQRLLAKQVRVLTVDQINKSLPPTGVIKG